MPIRHSFGALKGNWPWVIITAVDVLLLDRLHFQDVRLHLFLYLHDGPEGLGAARQ